MMAFQKSMNLIVRTLQKCRVTESLESIRESVERKYAPLLSCTALILVRARIYRCFDVELR